MENTKSVYTFALFFLLSTTAVMAADFLKADKIKSLVSGKTIHAKHLKKGFTFTVFFDTDGKTAFRKQAGKTTKTTYKIVGDTHCIFWKGSDRCANIIDNGNGTYSRVNVGGKKIVDWTKIENGKNL